MADTRCSMRGCRRIARREGLCVPCADAIPDGDDPQVLRRRIVELEQQLASSVLPPRLSWLDLARLARLDPKPGWDRNGSCYKRGNTRSFYPEGAETAAKAKAWCVRCPARYACLAVGLRQSQNTDHGVWGGTSMRDRVKIRRALEARSAA